ncbi:MAG: hypothetical protein NC084_02290 [Bacteroides sp.]|nr:hypothetical protein [Roseburia sp.]MCM1461525.1 hypothetical protein [Bacteroides sp.]
MLIYLGNDVMIPEEEILGVFDLERVTVDRYMKDFLNARRRGGEIYYVTLELPKSLVICEGMTYVCGVSSDTVKKRASRIEEAKRG